ncbi:MAG TPA: flagellar protein FlgN [Rhodocyclaceae bacterium]|jgi:flagella synthesis protein FlgN|nr:flagellar protein FlgN [Rhodocyclaceae bacterium]
MSTQLLDAVIAEAEILERFIGILEQEQKLLIGSDVNAVNPLLEQKSTLITELTEAGRQRETALAELGVDADKKAIETWLIGATPETQAAWNKLMELARTANQFNNNNGQIINTRMQYNQQALSVLMSAANADSGSTYGPDGHQRHGTGSRPLGQA